MSDQSLLRGLAIGFVPGLSYYPPFFLGVYLAFDRKKIISADGKVNAELRKRKIKEYLIQIPSGELLWNASFAPVYSLAEQGLNLGSKVAGNIAFGVCLVIYSLALPLYRYWWRQPGNRIPPK